MKVKLKGEIISDEWKDLFDYFGIENFAPKDLNEALSLDEPIDLEINSTGGSMIAAAEIYTSLINFKNDVNVLITGIAASAATIVSMAGTNVKISPVGSFMIHNALTSAYGNQYDLQQTVDMLRECDETIVNAYEIKTGLDRKELSELMKNETWFSPQQALDKGFVDEVLNMEYLKQTRELELLENKPI